MRTFDQHYIDGAFVPATGDEVVELLNPATGQAIGRARLGRREDARRAIEAAMRAQATFGRSTVVARVALLERLRDAMLANADALREASILEYGGPMARSQWVAQYAAQCFGDAARLLAGYAFERPVGADGASTLVMTPVGVAGLFAPWNAAAGTLASKLAAAIAAGCASVLKPSELSPWQAEIFARAVHEAGVPPGVVNLVIGRGEEVGDEIVTHPGVAKLSFTGSTATGKRIARAAVDTMKRVSLALSGKSASLLLDDADLAAAIPLALGAAFMNSGQACVAGTRLLVPRGRMDEVVERLRGAVAAMRVGDPGDPATTIGPMASQAQFDRIQQFIGRGLAQGATLVAGGPGRPDGLPKGWFARPTVFADVRNDMDIAREEIFGPVLSVLPVDSEDDAIAVANDSPYGLQAYVFSADAARARRVASRLEAGTVLINRVAPDLLAPFGGVKQSGQGREFGLAGLEAFLEPKTVTLG
ncbi:aldehyde dehydrogenase family protein [Mitsuaria sp. GD03876]|uniref:aldehyde dehydrogenase family protein n=1 Tax=Mitsuaria sp. GD03876 TaxID=2975399 RepID=UPI002448B2ED|nr:aldehyde dehydrogenase family protein [Mitsuaria sp. GD03876]MDH0866219.1 aldehyde dehydrogenase family protein [Mitsuaria sp. GD03876]